MNKPFRRERSDTATRDEQEPESTPAVTTNRHTALLWLLIFAAALRLPLAFWPNIQMPDEIYQFIEPAWRLLGHQSIITWEWRDGIRGWTMPTLLAPLIALGNWLAPDGYGLFVAPRLIAALASLSIVASAYGFGLRISRVHALIAGFVAAIWFELILFAPHTLGEPLATAMILPAAWLMLASDKSHPQLIAAGALLALAGVCRFQYGPAIAVLAIGTCWRQWDRLLPIAIGGIAILFVSGVIDASHGNFPFAWIITNIEHNLLHGRAESFGTAPLLAYFGSLAVWWSLAAPLLVLAIALGWRHQPLLLAMALTNFVFHSLVSHKEQRFIFLSVAIFVILAALGSVDLIARLRRLRALRRSAVPLVAASWLIVSAALGSTGEMPQQWMQGIGSAQLAATLRHDPAMCGLALHEVPYQLMPGRERLAGDVPLYYFDSTDPAVTGKAAQALQTAQPGFNRILSRRVLAPDVPASFVETRCAITYDTEVCIYARNGTCDAGPPSSFRLNDVLVRQNL